MAKETTNDAEDLQSVAEVLRGNTEAYREIVKRHQQTVYRLANSFLGNREDAKDATQDVFVKAFRLLHTFSLDKRFLPWLYTVTMNQLRTSYSRKKRKRDEEEFLDIEDTTYAPMEEFVRDDEREIVRNAVGQLSTPVREVVTLYYFEEMSVDEVATILEITKENVKSRLFRGRKALRTLLETSATPEDES